MIRSLTIIFLILILSNHIFSQNILLEKEVPDSLNSDTGPNKKNFLHPFISGGIFLPSGENLKIKPLGSFYYEFGLRRKYKVNNTLSEGIDLSVSQQFYGIKQISDKIFPDTVLYKSEKLKINSINLILFQRINFGNRGNYMGYFVDIGITGSWNYGLRRITIARLTDTDNGDKIKSIYFNPVYIERFGYGIIFRAGINRLVVQVKYNLSNIIKSSYYPDDIKGLCVGMQLGIHR